MTIKSAFRHKSGIDTVKSSLNEAYQVNIVLILLHDEINWLPVLWNVVFCAGYRIIQITLKSQEGTFRLILATCDM